SLESLLIIKGQTFIFDIVLACFGIFLELSGCNKILFMKKLLIVTVFFAACFMNSQNASAQVRVNVNVNIGDQPRWRVAGYDYVEYYYLPDIETYYYVPSHQFIYLSN